MSRVFIAWSGNKALANTLASYIRQNQPGIHCTVGGTDSVINESINATVKDQMMKCDRAIILLRKNDAGTLSGNVLFELGYLMYAEVMRENMYLSRTVEVQENQKVVSTGLYGIVRHPMYLATLFMFLPLPLILGSFWGLIPFSFYIVAIVIRIINEEKVLTKELDGYKEYKSKVKYRLIPFIW